MCQNEWIPKVLVVAIVIAIFTVFLLIEITNITGSEMQILSMIVGALTAKFSTIVDYYFGAANKPHENQL